MYSKQEYSKNVGIHFEDATMLLIKYYGPKLIGKIRLFQTST